MALYKACGLLSEANGLYTKLVGFNEARGHYYSAELGLSKGEDKIAQDWKFQSRVFWLQ